MTAKVQFHTDPIATIITCLLFIIVIICYIIIIFYAVTFPCDIHLFLCMFYACNTYTQTCQNSI